MKRRWLIRSLFLVFCLLTGAAWVTSYWKEFGFWSLNSRALTYCTIKCGYLRFYKTSVPVSRSWGFGWVHQPADPMKGVYLDLSYDNHGESLSISLDSNYGFPGFRFESERDGDRFLVIPMWFPTVGFAVCFCWTWRKTRAKAPGGAFPVAVEVDKEGA
jgi:hypothetical protein